MKNNLLIFGGGGFIGSSYYLEYKNFFNKVYIVDWFGKPTHEDRYLVDRLKNSLDEKDELINADIYDIESYREALSNCNTIYILNADTGTGKSYYEPYNSTLYNATAVAFIAEQIHRYHDNISKLSIFFASSRAVYGEGDWQNKLSGENLNKSEIRKAIQGYSRKSWNNEYRLQGFSESSKLEPLSVYGINKLFSEDILRNQFEGRIKRLAIGRFQNVYGAGQSRTNPYTGVLNWFTEKFLENQKVEIFDLGVIKRDFVHVSDVICSIHTMMEASGVFDVYSVGYGESYDLYDVALKLKDIFNSSSEVNIVSTYREGDVIGAFSDNTKLERLGFSPQVDVDSGLKEYANWYQNNSF